MSRRAFVAGAAAAGAAPFAARAQSSMPVIGYLSGRTPEKAKTAVSGFRIGLGEGGFAEGRDVAIEYRWAYGQLDRLPELARDLVQRKVAVIVTQTTPAALAAKRATSVIPIVFVAGFDPVADGFIASLNRPGGNATGVTLFLIDLVQKRLEVLIEVAPKAAALGALLNPTSPLMRHELAEMETIARARARTLRIVHATNPGEIDAAFAAFHEHRIGGLVLGSDPLMADEGERLAALAARLGVPTVYPFREHAEAGGLICVGTSIPAAYRLAGTLTAKVLKGAKPGELPVLQPSTVEVVVNLRTAKAQGINIPESLLARADEVIE